MQKLALNLQYDVGILHEPPVHYRPNICSLCSQVWSSRQTKMAPCHPTFCTKLDKTPALLRRPMKSDGRTGVPGPTLGGNSTSSMVLFGSRVSDQNAEHSLYTGIYDTDLNMDLIHNLSYVSFIGLLQWLESEEFLQWTHCFSAVCRWQQPVL